MASHDMKKTLKHLYNPSAKTVSIVDVQEMNYLMIDGTGDTSSEQYQQSVEALYGLAHSVRAVSKLEGFNFTIMPLESLWSFDDTIKALVWTLMILQPAHVIDEDVDEAREIVRKKKTPKLLDDVRFEGYHEGESAQIMHVGSHGDQRTKFNQLHTYITANDWEIGKRYHEIYLNDPLKVAPSKLKTIIRQPFERD